MSLPRLVPSVRLAWPDNCGVSYLLWTYLTQLDMEQRRVRWRSNGSADWHAWRSLPTKVPSSPTSGLKFSRLRFHSLLWHSVHRVSFVAFVRRTRSTALRPARTLSVRRPFAFVMLHLVWTSLLRVIARCGLPANAQACINLIVCACCVSQALPSMWSSSTRDVVGVGKAGLAGDMQTVVAGRGLAGVVDSEAVAQWLHFTNGDSPLAPTAAPNPDRTGPCPAAE